MNWFSVLSAALMAYFSKQTSFRLGSMQVSISEGGSAVHLTLGVVIQAAEMVLSGQTGTIACGVFTVSISPWVAAPAATPDSVMVRPTGATL